MTQKIKVTLVRGLCRSDKKQRATIKGLGLSKKINSTAVLEATAPVLGMINKVKHLIKYEEQ
jgi:large subunit ribosomal protein L30